METLVLENSRPYLLLQSLADLHHKAIEWQSRIEFWKMELTFFAKLIKRYGLRIRLKHNIDECRHLRQLLKYYAGDMISSLTHLISRHEQKLKFLLSHGKVQDEAAFRAEHEALEHQLDIVSKEINAYKNELFVLIEKVLSKNAKTTVL